MPPIWRLVTRVTRGKVLVLTSIQMGLAALPMPLTGIAVLNVATSAFCTALPAFSYTPGTARLTQLPILVQVLSTGALVQVWEAAWQLNVAMAEPMINPTEAAIFLKRWGFVFMGLGCDWDW